MLVRCKLCPQPQLCCDGDNGKPIDQSNWSETTSPFVPAVVLCLLCELCVRKRMCWSSCGAFVPLPPSSPLPLTLPVLWILVSVAAWTCFLAGTLLHLPVLLTHILRLVMTILRCKVAIVGTFRDVHRRTREQEKWPWSLTTRCCRSCPVCFRRLQGRQIFSHSCFPQGQAVQQELCHGQH